MKRVEIPLSKTKILLLVGGSVLFVVASLFLIFVLSDQQTKLNPMIIKGIGIIGVLFFGATGIVAARKVFDKKMGLIIDENGIIDNSSGVSIGLIKWSDITAIKTEEISSTQFLLIYVSNPDFYLSQAKGLKRKMMEANNRMFGTPLSMSSNGLKCKFSELEKLLHENLNKYRTIE